MKKLFSIQNTAVVDYQWQKKSSSLLAILFGDNIQIYNKKGKSTATVPIESECRQIQWSWNGKTLAILLKSADILLWDVTGVVKKVATDIKSLAIMEWSLDNEILAAGSGKGEVLLFHLCSGSFTSSITKHSHGITSMAWNTKKQLVCSSSDGKITLIDSSGELIYSTMIKGDPSYMQWCRDELNEKLLVVKGKKSILIYPNLDFTNPIELSMNSRYGYILDASWANEGTAIIVAFTSGYLVSVSAEQQNLGAHIYQSKIYKSSMQSVSFSTTLRRISTCGDSVINVQDMGDLKVFNSSFYISEGKLSPERLQFSDDGQFLSVLTKEKDLLTFLAKPPCIFSSREERVAHLVEPKLLSVVNVGAATPESISIDLDFEPSVISVGPKLLAVAENNTVVYYELTSSTEIKVDQIDYTFPKVSSKAILACQGKLGERIFPSTIISLENNFEYGMVFCSSGTVYIHPLVSKHLLNPKSQIEFKEPEGIIITAATLSLKFLVYATSDGYLHHYDLKELIEFQKCSIGKKVVKKIIIQPGNGTKMLLIDEQNDLVVFNPLTQISTAVIGWDVNYIGCLWDERSDGKNVFVSWNEDVISVFSYHLTTTKGPQCFSLNVNTKLPFGFKPVQFRNGTVICKSLSGTLECVSLFSHKSYTSEEFLTRYPDEFDQAKLLKVMYLVGTNQIIWTLHPQVSSKKAWLMVAEGLLQLLEVAAAKRIFRMLGDIGMVLNLERIIKCEEKFELLGHIFVILRDYNQAQEYFLKSSKPKEAFYLRRDLLEWEQALNLAKKYAPEEVSEICLEYGNQLEMDSKVIFDLGQFGEAHTQFEMAIKHSVDFEGTSKEMETHIFACKSGYIRMLFALGEVSKGMSLLSKLFDRRLVLDCISIMLPLKMYVEVAQLYEKIEDWDNAAETYIKAKNWHMLAHILAKVKSKSVFKHYGAAKEAEGNYADAASAYEKAEDYDAVTRIVIEKLNNLEGGAALVRKTKAEASARLLASRYLTMREYQKAIEFYLIGGMQIEAFTLAKQHLQIEFFVANAINDLPPDLIGELLDFLKSKGQFYESGKIYLHLMEYSKALEQFIKCPINNDNASELAIETVTKARDRRLTNLLIDFFVGEKDGIPKKPKFIYKLYTSLGQYKDAANAALILAREEQDLGNYGEVHALLVDNWRRLRKISADIPIELEDMLTIVHSYVIVKPLVRAGENFLATRMLVRVSQNIDKFPAHTVPLLTSTVIECYRAGFKNEAFKFASILMKPENRPKVDEKFRRKIETIIRRPESDDAVENLSPCPFCSTSISETNLICSECESRIPFCIYTGKHMVRGDWSQCPSCKFPALLSHARELSKKIKNCPICDEATRPSELIAIKPVLNMGEDNVPINDVVGGLTSS